MEKVLQISNEKCGKSKKIFSVVQFMDEGKERPTISTVPTKWIFNENNNIMCKWPNFIIDANFLKQNKDADITWKSYMVVVVGNYCTFDEAWQKEQRYTYTSESDRDLGRGKRKKRKSTKILESTNPPILSSSDTDTTSDNDFVPRANYSSCPSKYFKLSKENMKPENYERLLLKLCSPNDKIRQLHITNDAEAEAVVGCSSAVLSSVDDNTSKKTHIKSSFESDVSDSDHNQEMSENSVAETMSNSSIQTITNETTNNSITTNNVLTEHHNENNMQVVANKDILEIKAELKLLNDRFSFIERTINKFAGQITMPEGLNFPLNTLEELEEFNKKLSNGNFYKQMLAYTSNIGGLDFKNFTRRSLDRFFSNNLGRICSWTGQKNNYRIKNLKLIELIIEAAKCNYSVNESQFETTVKEWFRHSNTRLKRTGYPAKKL